MAKVELYKSGPIEKQIARGPEMGRVDTGASALPQATGQLTQAAFSIAKTEQESREKQGQIDAKDLYLTFKQGLADNDSAFLSLKGEDAIKEEESHRQRVKELVSSTRKAAEERGLPSSVFKNLDQMMQENVIGAGSRSTAHVSSEQDKVIRAKNKQIADASLDNAFLHGQSFSTAKDYERSARVDFVREDLDASVEAHLAVLRYNGVLNEETEAAERGRVKSAFGLMLMQGAANTGGSVSAKEMSTYLAGMGVSLKGEDAVKGKKLIESLERSEKEDNRNTRIGNYVSQFSHLTTEAEIQAASGNMDADVRVAVVNALSAQLRGRKAEEAKIASDAYDELNRFVQEPGNEALTPDELAQAKPELWAAIKDNKQLIQRLIGRDDIQTKWDVYGEVLAMSPEQYLQAYTEGEQGVRDGEENEFFAYIRNNTSASDTRFLMNRVTAAIQSNGKKGLEGKPGIEANFMQNVHTQAMHEAVHLFGGGSKSYNEMSPSNKRRADAFITNVNSTVRYEISQRIARGESPVLPQPDFLRILKEHGMRAPDDRNAFTRYMGWFKPGNVSEFAPETAEWAYPLFEKGARPEAIKGLLELYEDKPQDAQAAMDLYENALAKGGYYDDLVTLEKMPRFTKAKLDEAVNALHSRGFPVSSSNIRIFIEKNLEQR